MSDDDRFDRDEVVVSQMWRFTAVPTTVLGLHSSVLIPVLLMPLAAALHLFKPVLWLGIAYAGFVFWLQLKWGITPGIWLQMMFTRFVKGNAWRVR